jgi:hypothetical protein
MPLLDAVRGTATLSMNWKSSRCVDDPWLSHVRTVARSIVCGCACDVVKLDAKLAAVHTGLALCSQYPTAGSDAPTVTTSDEAPTSRAQLEAHVDALRLNTTACEPYTKQYIDYGDEYMSKTSGCRSFDDACALVIYASQMHAQGIDRKPMNQARIWSMGLSGFISSYMPEEFRRRFSGAMAGDTSRLFIMMFSHDGDADNEYTLTEQRRVHRERQHWLSVIFRIHSVDMSGGLKSNVPLAGAHSPIPSQLVHRSDGTTRFHQRAKAYTNPTADEVDRAVSPHSTSTHPALAAYRHLNTTSIRKLVRGLGAVQLDTTISSAPRDKMAHGRREVIQLKDLRHVGPSTAPDIDELREDLNGCEPKTVVTLLDTLTYMTSLREHAGNDIIATVPIYSSLSGNFKESMYYCHDVDEHGHALYCETIGENNTSSVFRDQRSWDFGENDVVYIPNSQGTGFGVYDVVKHCRHDINRQTVFLSMNTWVNMPFEIADQLALAAHGVRFSDMYSEPHPCKNVKIMNGESKHPILVMSVVKGHERIVYTRYQDETSAAGTATVLPPVLRFIQHLYSHGGRAHGLSSREILQRLQLYMSPMLPGGKADAPDYTSLLELFRVVGPPDELPCAVFYSVEEFKAENPGEEAPSENRAAKAVVQAPSIVTCPKIYGVTAPDEVATEVAAEEHLGEGNTKVRGLHMQKLAAFAQRHFIAGLEKHSGCAPGTVTVVPREKVIENRNRPTQKANEITSGLGPSPDDEMGRAFVKMNEVAALKSAARMIQSPPHELSIDSGRLGMSLDKIVKATDGESNGVGFYCPGKTPTEISEALRSQYAACKTMRNKFGAGKIPQVDYSAADKSHSEESAELVADIIRHFFSDEHCPDLNESHKAWALRTYYNCFNIRVQAGKKVKSTKWKNASGTGITTLLNTLVFGFRSYLTVILSLFFNQMAGDDGVIHGFPTDKDGNPDPVAAGGADWFTNIMFRAQLKVLQAADHHWWDEAVNTNGLPMSPGAARQVMELLFYLIGLKYGDDGVEFNVPGVSDDCWLLACKYLDATDGFRRTLGFSDPKDDAEIEFLSRNYPNLTETGASYCKIERAAEKLRISTNADPLKYRDKLVGYMITDRHTPVIGAFINAIWYTKDFGRMYEQFDDYDRGILCDAYLKKVESTDRELARKMREGPFPVSEDDQDIMYEAVAAQHGWTSGELRAFDTSLSAQRTLEGIRAHKLPPALANLTADDPLGDDIVQEPPVGVAMTAAFPNEKALHNAMPDSARRKARATLEGILGTL